jgi:hypothetical protein
VNNVDISSAVTNVQYSPKPGRIPVIKGPLLGLFFILFFPFIGLATVLVLCGLCLKQSCNALLHRNTKVVTAVK